MATVGSSLTRLIQELRRRRLFRTAAWYIVGSWLALQAGDVVFPALDIEERAIRYVLIAAVLGFPVALVFGWFYDISPQGIRRTHPAGQDEQDRARPLQRRDYVALTALAGVLLAIIFTAATNMRQLPPTPVMVQNPSGTEQRDGPPMLAVLPFVSTSLDEDSAFFAAGMHDDLLTQLAQLQNIRVVSRTSVMEFKDVERNLREIGAALGADAILEGGVQRSGEQIRINMQLIDARTDEHLWAQTFDRSLTTENVFTVQSDIARAVTAAMQTSLTEQDSRALDVIPTQNMAAYRAFHRALQLRYGPGDPYDRDEEIAALRQAVALDPGFARAWAELVYPLSYLSYYIKNDESVAQAEQALEQLRAIAPDSANYLLAQAYFTYFALRDYETALLLVDQALQLMPSDIGVWQLKNWIQRRLGDYEGRPATLRTLMALDSRNPVYAAGLIDILILQHRYDEAAALLTQASPDSSRLQANQNLMRLREHGDLQRWARDELALAEEYSDDPWGVNDYGAMMVLGDYAGIRAAAAQQTEPQERADLIGPLATEIILQALEGNDAGLSQAVAAGYAHLEKHRDQGGEFERIQRLYDFALLSAVTGEREEAERYLRRWFREAEEDQTTFPLNMPFACQVLGLAASTEAVACLRRGFTEPSALHTFFDPYLPFYDSLREEPEFVALIAEIEAGLCCS